MRWIVDEFENENTINDRRVQNTIPMKMDFILGLSCSRPAQVVFIFEFKNKQYHYVSRWSVWVDVGQRAHTDLIFTAVCPDATRCAPAHYKFHIFQHGRHLTPDANEFIHEFMNEKDMKMLKNTRLESETLEIV